MPKNTYIKILRAAAWLPGLGASLFVSATVFIKFPPLPASAAFLSIAAITWFHPRFALIAFTASVPVCAGFNAIFLHAPLFILNIPFSFMLPVWLLRSLTNPDHSPPIHSSSSMCLDLLSLVVALSLLATLTVFPPDLVFEHLCRLPLFSLDHPFYPLTASIILLQGIAFCRMIETELAAPLSHSRISLILHIHVAVVLFFAAFQIITAIPPLKELSGTALGIYSPFEDVHSAGSAALLLIFPIAGLWFSRRKPRNRIYLIALISMAAFILLTFSRTTWLACLCMILLHFAWQRRLRAFLITVSTVLLIFAAVQLAAHHTGLAPSIKKRVTGLEHSILKTRIPRWKISGNMIQNEPLAGVGIGNYFRLYPYSVTYTSRPIENWQLQENAHNYYLQLATETGLPGLLLLLLAFGTRLGRFFFKKNQPPLRFLPLGIGAYLISCIGGHPLLLPTQQFIFWFYFAALSAPPPHQVNAAPQRNMQLVAATLAILALTGHIGRFSTPGHQAEYTLGIPVPTRTAPLFFAQVPATTVTRVVAKEEHLALRVRVSPPEDGQFRPTNLIVKLNGQLTAEKLFTSPGTRDIRFSAPGTKGRFITLTTHLHPKTNNHSDAKSSFPLVEMESFRFLRIPPALQDGTSNELQKPET